MVTMLIAKITAIAIAMNAHDLYMQRYIEIESDILHFKFESCYYAALPVYLNCLLTVLATRGLALSTRLAKVFILCFSLLFSGLIKL